MPSSIMMTIKLDPHEKALFAENAEALGLTPSAAIKIFIKRFNEYQGFPFEVRRRHVLNPAASIPVAKIIDNRPVMPESWLDDDEDSDEWL